MKPYIRVKRHKTTVFLDVELTDTFMQVKERLGLLFDMPAQNMQLWSGLQTKESKEYPDAAALSDHSVQSDTIVYMCWKKENSDQWEELSVENVEAMPTDAPKSE